MDLSLLSLENEDFFSPIISVADQNLIEKTLRPCESPAGFTLFYAIEKRVPKNRTWDISGISLSWKLRLIRSLSTLLRY